MAKSYQPLLMAVSFEQFQWPLEHHLLGILANPTTSLYRIPHIRHKPNRLKGLGLATLAISQFRK